ncbi:MAG: glycosyltransferase, partial [Pedosphaera sp.]|nr:glycosyltransferase [Pedosphaera sp.]
EIILVDGGSTDTTRDIATANGCSVLPCEPSRGRQLRLGAQQARGDVVLLLHADTWLLPESGRLALDCLRDTHVVAGGFYKRFRDPHWLMRGSRFRCWLRWAFFRRLLGDQAMFIRRAALEEIGGVPDVPLMEEYELLKLLRPLGRIALARSVVSTSARRFRERGVLRTYWRMAIVTARYFLGASPDELRRAYERR